MVTRGVEGAPADCLDTYEGSYLCLVHAKDCGDGISLIHLAKKLKYDVYNLADGTMLLTEKLRISWKSLYPMQISD